MDSTDEKLVVFCHHVHLAKELIAEVNRRGKAKLEHKPIAVGFTGETSAVERDKAIKKFQDTKAKYPARVLVTTVGAGGTGLNLQVANQMLIVEATFSVGEMLQAEDRIRDGRHFHDLRNAHCARAVLPCRGLGGVRFLPCPC